MGKDGKKEKKKKGFFLFRGNFWAHTFFKVLIAALVVAWGWMLLSMARDRAVKLDDFQFNLACLDLTAKPPWVRGNIEDQVRSVPPSTGNISLLDANATRKVASTLSANPWIKKVKSVIRDFPNRVRAEVELRDPAAFVLRAGRFYLVDSEGVRLPGEYGSMNEAGLDLPMIVYVRSSPPAAGMAWDDPAVVEGAKVAALLKQNSDVVKAARIVAIDSSNIGGRRTPRESEITLITADRTQIFWGRGVNYSGATELPAAKKMENLRAVIRREGSLADKEYVDLRFPNPVFRDRKYYLGSL
jgi:cell division septal protein FtsQ